MAYNIQSIFHYEGYFLIKITPLGANLCLMEEWESGEQHTLVHEAKDWISPWFVKMK